MAAHLRVVPVERLNSPIFGSGGILGGPSIAAQAAALTPAGSSFGAFDAAGVGAAAASPTVTLGALLGGAGAGFGVGSLAGMGVQSLLGKTGPAPTVGAGVGAAAGAAIGSIIPGIGTLIGGLLGGALTGAGGGILRRTP
jgi:hypothetical protein